MAQVLIIDDEEKIRSTLKDALSKRGHSVVTAESITTGKTYLSAGFDIIFLDVMLPDGNGIDLLQEIRQMSPEQTIVMISGHADISMAIEALKLGAYDFLEKPLSLDRILVTITNAVKTDSLIRERDRLTSMVYGTLIGETPAITRLTEDIKKSAPRTSRFLITGENGTGKELIAHLVHQYSQFNSGPFIAINCAALPSELVESELFGHTAGAFTGATKARKGKFVEANGGSIFLDEISEMPMDMQAKLLRAVETKTITPVGSDSSISLELNIIAASNRDLELMAANNKFRQDLLYRLNVVHFEIPPLRDRKGDIPILSDYFLTLFAAETKSKPKQLDKEAITFLQAFDFPGNIRELKNLMERLNIYSDKTTIERADLEPLMPFIPQNKPQSLKESVAAFEKQQIQNALDKYNGVVSKAARELGLERSLLYKKMKKYQINE